MALKNYYGKFNRLQWGPIVNNGSPFLKQNT